MKYKREYSIVTKLSKEQVLDRLQNVTCAYDKCDDRFDFEGKITGNTFTLYQLFDYGSNNQIRPKIYGLIKEEKENRVLELTFTLPYGMKMFFLLAFIGNFIFFCLELTVLKNSFDDKMTLIHSVFLVIGYLGSLLFFYNKVDKSVKVLSSLILGEVYSNKSFWEQGV